MPESVKMAVKNAEVSLKEALDGKNKPTVLILVGWEDSGDIAACRLHVSGNHDVLAAIVRGACDMSGALKFAICNAVFGRVSKEK